jgi:hypothetical protein
MEKKTDSVEKRILDSVVDGRIPCPVLRAIAEDEGIPYSEAGRIANQLKVKISNCELGCF